MIISDVNRILGIDPGLGDRHFPSDGRTFHMMNDPAMHKRSESEREPERWYYDGLEYLAKGNYEVLLTPLKPVPHSWLGDVKGKKILFFDFVYGRFDNYKFIPFDGQQRLTTLFLFHKYVLAFKKMM